MTGETAINVLKCIKSLEGMGDGAYGVARVFNYCPECGQALDWR